MNGTTPATRTEIELHIRALNVAWEYYGDVESGRYFAYAPHMKSLQMDQAARECMQVFAWLAARNITENNGMLTYDPATRSYALSPNWRSAQEEEEIALLQEISALLAEIPEKQRSTHAFMRLRAWIARQLTERGAPIDKPD